MASKTIRGLTVEIGGDTKKLSEALKEPEKRLKGLQTELKDINQLLRFDPSNTDELTHKTTLLSKAIEACSDKLKELAVFEQKMASMESRTKEEEEQYRALQREIMETESKMHNYEKQLRGTYTVLGKLGEAGDDVQEALRKMKEEADASKTPFQKLSESMAGLNKDSANLSSELKDIDKALKESPGDVQLLSQKYKVLSEALENSSERYDTLRKVQKEAVESGEASESQLRDIERQVISTRNEMTRYSDALSGFKTETLNLISGIKTEEQAFEELQDSIKKVDSDSKSLSSELKAIDNTLKSSPGNVTMLSQRYDVLSEMVETCAQKLELVEQAEQEVQRRFEQGEASAQQVRKLQREIEDTADELRRYQSEMEEADRAVNNFGNESQQAANKVDDLADEADDAKDKISALDRVAASAGDGFTTFKGVISNLISEGLEVLVEKTIEAAQYIGNLGMDFGQSMSKVEALLGLYKSTGTEMEELTQLAMDLGAETKFSANESAEAMTYLAQAGWETQDILDGLSGVMYLAASDGVELASAAEITATTLNALGQSADKASTFADILATVAADTCTDVESMGYTFQYVAPVAGTLGYSMEDLAVAIGLMANNSITGEKAGTALRGLLTNLAKGSGEAGTAMEKYGISLTDANGEMKPLSQLLEELRSKFSGLSKDEKAAAAGMLAGKTGMAGLLSIINASDEDFQTLTKNINESKDASKDMATVMQDNLAGDVEKMCGAFDNVGLSIMQKFDLPLRDAVKAITKFLEGGMSMQDLLVILTEAFAGLGAKFQEYMPTLMQMGQDLLIYIINGITVGLPTLMSAATDLVSNLCTFIAQNAPTIVNIAGDLLTSFVQGVFNFIPRVIEGAAQIVGSLAQGIGQNAQDFVSKGLDLLDGFADKLTSAFPKLITAGMDFLLNLVKGLVQAIPEFVQRAPEIISKFANLINDNVPIIFKKGAQIVWELIKGVGSMIVELVKNWKSVLKACVDVWEAFNWLNLGKQVFKLLGSGLKAMWGLLKNIGSGTKDLIVNALKNLPTTLKTLGTKALQFFSNAIKGGWSWVKSGINTIKDGIINALMNLPDKMYDIAVNLVEGLWNGIKSMASWICEKVMGWGGMVINAVKAIFQEHSPSRVMATSGKNLVLGLAEGLDDNAKVAVKSAENLARNVLDGASMDGLALERNLQNRTIQHAMSVTTAADSSMLGKLDKILTAIEKGQVIKLDSKALVGGTATMYDNALGQRRMLAARGAV